MGALGAGSTISPGFIVCSWIRALFDGEQKIYQNYVLNAQHNFIKQNLPGVYMTKSGVEDLDQHLHRLRDNWRVEIF